MDSPRSSWAVSRPSSKETPIDKGQQGEVAEQEVSAARRIGQNLDRHGGTPKTHSDLGMSVTIVRDTIDFAKDVVGSRSVLTAALWHEPLVAVGASATGRDFQFTVASDS
jgi:hypothetical protein